MSEVEAEALDLMLQTLPVKQQVGCLHFVVTWMSTKPEWPALRKGLDVYAEAFDAFQSRHFPRRPQQPVREPKGFRTMAEDATKEQREAGKLSHALQTLSAEEQGGCLRFLVGYMGTRPEWSAMKEAVDFYVRESKIGPFEMKE